MIFVLFVLMFQGCLSSSEDQKNLEPEKPVSFSETFQVREGAIEPHPEQGLIWMPLVWKLSQKVASGKELVPHLSFKSPLLIFEDLKRGREISHKLWFDGPADPGRLIHLDQKKRFQELVSSSFFQLPPGDYLLKSIRLYYLDEKQQSSIIQLAFPNPISQEETKPLMVRSRANEIGLVGRLVVKTELKKNRTGLFSASQSYLLDEQHIEQGFFEKFTGQSFQGHLVKDGTQEFNHILRPLSDQPHENHMRSGVRVLYPCVSQEEKVLRFFLSREGSRDFFFWDQSLQPHPSREKLCAQFVSFYLPQGSWNLVGVNFEENRPQIRDVFSFVKHLSPFAQKYLQTHEKAFLPPLKPQGTLGFQVGDAPAASMHFLGTLLLTHENSEKTSKWAPHFLKIYQLPVLLKGFQSDQIINAYTGQNLAQSKKKGSFQIAFERKVMEKGGHVWEGFQKKLLDNFQTCVVQMEQRDPLLTFQGVFELDVREKSDVLFEPKSFSSHLTQQQKDALLLCFRQQIDRSSFSSLDSLEQQRFHLKMAFN